MALPCSATSAYRAAAGTALLIAAAAAPTPANLAAPPAARQTTENVAADPGARAAQTATSGPAAAPGTASETGIPFKAIRPDAADAVRYVPALVALMTDPQAAEAQRRQAALLLGRMGPRAAAAVPHLARLLRTTIRNVQLGATADSHNGERGELTTRLLWELKAVSLFGPVAAPVCEDVIGVAEDVQMPLPVRLAAYEALARIGPAAPPAVAALSDAITRPRFAPQTSDSDRTFFRAAVLECVALLGPAAEPLLPTLIRLLDAPDELLRRRALACLYALGQRAAAAQPAVLRVLVFDEEPAVREAAAATLARLGPDTLKPLLRLLEDDDPELRRLAALALQQHSQIARVLTELTVHWKAESDPVTWITLAETICEAAPQAARAHIPELLQRWNTSPRAVRIRLYRLLQRLTAARPDIRAEIRTHLPDPAPAVLNRLVEERNSGHR